jgi:hypothetical protein
LFGHRTRRRTRPIRGGPALASLMMAGLLAGACAGNGADGGPSTSAAIADPTVVRQGDAIVERLDTIDNVVADWRNATDLAAARAGAEATRNLVVGPAGPGYGDADGDGTISGASTIGLLPGLGGEPGLVSDGTATSCIEADVLGGSWADAATRWATLRAAIDGWSPSNNTFPSLPSHPQRIVGWATLTIATDELSGAIEYGGHAAIHSTITRAAVTDCGS